MRPDIRSRLPETNNEEESICREKAIGKQISVLGAKCCCALYTINKYGDKIAADVRKKEEKKNFTYPHKRQKTKQRDKVTHKYTESQIRGEERE